MSAMRATWPALGAADDDPAAAFATAGAAALGRVLDDAQLAAARAACDELAAHGITGGYACIIQDAWRKAPALGALVEHVGARACAALGIPALVLFHDHVLIKPARGDDMEWHQDFSYLPLDRPDGMTLWIAIDDVTEDSGCLYYVFGTHTQGERRAAWGLYGDDDPRAGLPPIDVAADEPGVAAPTAAGCAIAHHTYVWHRSPSAARGRRAWALSFTTPDARWSPRHALHMRSAIAPKTEGQELEPDLPRVSVSR
jgi:ectoine hydroxylase-related dioxygenase (phytanoyl-CoA dioxygenase family)